MPVFERSQYIRKSVHFKPRCTIPQPLLRWLIETVNPDGDRRGLIVLSHHGGFSSFSDWYQIPAQQLARLIHRPVIWFWGHEHKVAIYDRFAVRDGIQTYGRCVGHGGMPVERGAEPDINDCRWLAWDNRRYDNGEPIDAGYNGHATLGARWPGHARGVCGLARRGALHRRVARGFAGRPIGRAALAEDSAGRRSSSPRTVDESSAHDAFTVASWPATFRSCRAVGRSD